MNPTIVERAYRNCLASCPMRRNFGEMMAQTLANEALSTKQRLYIAEMLEDQLTIELQVAENLALRAA